MLELAIILFFPFFMAYAAASDLVSMTISNKISLALIAGFMVFSLAIGMPWQQIAMHWAMFAVMLGVGIALFAFGAAGGGDAKLAAATALWLGWEQTFPYILFATFFGGILALVILKLRTAPLPESLGRVPWLARLYRADEGIPYGIALAAAAFVVYPQTPWMQHVFAVARQAG